MLKRVTLQSSGLYRCEVSGEAPAFNTVSESETMTVVGKSAAQRVLNGISLYCKRKRERKSRDCNNTEKKRKKMKRGELKEER